MATVSDFVVARHTFEPTGYEGGFGSVQAGEAEVPRTLDAYAAYL
ncbi:hypothetical protein [Streptomyces sp. NPDC048142]